MRYEWGVSLISEIRRATGVSGPWAPLLWLPVAWLAVGCAGASGTGRAPGPSPHDPTYGDPAASPPPGSGASVPGDADPTAPPGWPSELVASPGTGPSLYRGPDPDAPPLGYVSAGVRLQLAGPPQGERIPVVVPGPLEARAWLPTSRLAGRILERGRVVGSPGYVGPGDVVRILGTADEGLMRIELRPPLRSDVSLPAMEAVYPVARIGARQPAPGDAPGPNPGTPMALPPGQQVPVYDRAEGQVVSTLPATEPPLRVVVLVDHGAWKGVRVGTGPYLVGFLQAELTPVDAPEAPPGDPLAHPTADGPVPIRLMAEPNRPLWRVRAGTRITFNQETIAIAHQDALAREMVRHEGSGEVDVFVAVDDTVAVRGMVDADALQPTQAGGQGGSAPSPAGDPAP
jgi:hypothetical protein